MKAHKYWSLGALACMAGCFYTGCKKLMQAHKYFACGSLVCMGSMIKIAATRFDTPNAIKIDSPLKPKPTIKTILIISEIITSRKLQIEYVTL